MASQGLRKQQVVKQPMVRFTIETKVPTPEQQEAGKRLFGKLLARAEANLLAESGTSAGPERSGPKAVRPAEPPPAEQPPSLTNRGAATYTETSKP